MHGLIFSMAAHENKHVMFINRDLKDGLHLWWLLLILNLFGLKEFYWINIKCMWEGISVGDWYVRQKLKGEDTTWKCRKSANKKENYTHGSWKRKIIGFLSALCDSWPQWAASSIPCSYFYDALLSFEANTMDPASQGLKYLLLWAKPNISHSLICFYGILFSIGMIMI